jgi:hypothetical protein
MEGKRKREDTDAGENPRTIHRKGKTEEEEVSVGWNSLPTEIAQYVLQFIVALWDNDIASGADVTSAVCRFVCRQWRDLLPPPKEDTWEEGWFAAAAAKFGYLSLLKWAVSQGCPFADTACMEAARGGHLETLTWLVETDCSCDYLATTFAVEEGHLHILKYLRENDGDFTELVCARAARRGNLEILKWLRENEYPWDHTTCEYAAEGGQLEVLKWATKNGCTLTKETCKKATEGGHLKLLKWLRRQECPWIDTAGIAARKGYLKMLK